ncbi:MAG: aminopeptidase P N-terminal domain-containing protein [Alistipes sp.]|nr:aminopeptidase P N-terminal domain-containing protein [Alistipes sp.]
MFSKETYVGRRAELCRRVGKGLILLPANPEVPNNYPNNTYYYRQDSTFRYYFGLDVPSLMGLLDAESGEAMLFGDDFTVEDIIWTGPMPTLSELGAEVGVEKCFPKAEVRTLLKKAIEQNRPVHYLPPYRAELKIELADLLGIRLAMLHERKSLDLMFAIAEMREKKSAEEIEALERAFKIGYQMHMTAMRMCRPGVVEREIAGRVEGIAKSYGQGVSFPTIVTQHGEILHNHNHDGVLEAGRLLLVDGGGESVEGYCSDHTRTYPVNGKFTDLQRDIYNIVLRAHGEVKDMIKPGTMYPEIHRAAYLSLADGLKGMGLIKSTPEVAVEAGAMYLFMPHGLGHGMGMDVHDLENIGERSFDFSTVAERAAKSATCIHRATWRVEPGTVMSDEPGIYFIPALIDKMRSEGKFTDIVDYNALDAYRTFGGIRIEDDVLVTETGSRFIGDKLLPLTVEELEAVVGADYK